MLVLLFIVPLLAVGWSGYPHTGSGFMPAMDEGGFILDYRAAPGTSLTETDRLLRQVEEILRAHARGADLLAPHRSATRRRRHRGQQGRLLRPPEAAAAPRPSRR